MRAKTLRGPRPQPTPVAEAARARARSWLARILAVGERASGSVEPAAAGQAAERADREE
jgi:hypothetical protein